MINGDQTKACLNPQPILIIVQPKLQPRRQKKRKKQQRLTGIKTGLLQGFVPIRPEWKTISHARLWSATARAMGEYYEDDEENNMTGAEEAPESED